MQNSILEKLWRRQLIDRVIVQDTESKDTPIDHLTKFVAKRKTRKTKNFS